MGRGEQHGEAGDDGEQGVDNQAEAVNHLLSLLLLVVVVVSILNHHRRKLPVSLNRRGLVLLLHLQRSLIKPIKPCDDFQFSWQISRTSLTQNTSNLCSRSILYFDASKFTSMD